MLRSDAIKCVERTCTVGGESTFAERNERYLFQGRTDLFSRELKSLCTQDGDKGTNAVTMRASLRTVHFRHHQTTSRG